MTAQEVREKLDGCKSWDNASMAARDCFFSAALHIQYGRSEVRNAWEWYYAGWLIATYGEKV